MIVLIVFPAQNLAIIPLLRTISTKRRFVLVAKPKPKNPQIKIKVAENRKNSHKTCSQQTLFPVIFLQIPTSDDHFSRKSKCSPVLKGQLCVSTSTISASALDTLPCSKVWNFFHKLVFMLYTPVHVTLVRTIMQKSTFFPVYLNISVIVSIPITYHISDPIFFPIPVQK